MTERLAIDGGPPVRSKPLPYGRHLVEEDDVSAVAAALRSDWLTTGPLVGEFEAAFSKLAGTRHAVAVNSGTAALHASMYALGLGPGDHVLVPAITFAASANAALYVGATPHFVDIDPDTLLVSVEEVRRRLTPSTKALVAVDYAGQPCDYDELAILAESRGIAIIADACHALGASYRGRPVGSLGTTSTFSLHPVKPITSGEGGVVTTNDTALAERVRQFRNHGISTEHREREAQGTWEYEMIELGFNYRLADINCALAASQLSKLGGWTNRRRKLAARYDRAFMQPDSPVTPLAKHDDREHAYHLYVVKLRQERLRVTRARVFAALRAEGIGVNVHYRPVYLHPYYARLGYAVGSCPAAELAYEGILTLPLFPRMTDRDADDVIAAIAKVGEAYGV